MKIPSEPSNNKQPRRKKTITRNFVHFFDAGKFLTAVLYFKEGGPRGWLRFNVREGRWISFGTTKLLTPLCIFWCVPIAFKSYIIFFWFFWSNWKNSIARLLVGCFVLTLVTMLMFHLISYPKRKTLGTVSRSAPCHQTVIMSGGVLTFGGCKSWMFIWVSTQK